MHELTSLFVKLLDILLDIRVSECHQCGYSFSEFIANLRVVAGSGREQRLQDCCHVRRLSLDYSSDSSLARFAALRTMVARSLPRRSLSSEISLATSALRFFQ